MPKKRQVPRLFAQQHASGNVTYHWKPSRKLRALGWASRALGADQIEATRAALALNEAVDAALKPSQAPAAPRHMTMGELLDRFLVSAAFTDTAPNTQKDYRLRCRELRQWTLDGKVTLRDLANEDGAIARFTEDSRATTSVSVTASRLRCLRVVLNWGRKSGGVDRETKTVLLDLVEQIAVPRVERRKVGLDWPAVEAIAAQADTDGCTFTGPALRFGFWTLQRQGDLLDITRFAWQEIVDIDPRDRAILTGPNGKVMGLWLTNGQHKTKVPVVCPIPPFLHDELAARFKRSPLLFPCPDNPERPVDGDRFRKIVNPTLRKLGGGEAVHKDMRRSGMSWMRRLGANPPDIRSISGHATPNENRMDEVYMPHDPRAACRAMAVTLRAMAEIAAREAEQESALGLNQSAP